MTQPIDRTFFSETMRSMYRIYGFETVMKEILFLHHIEQSPGIHVAPTPGPVEVIEPVIQASPIRMKRPIVKSFETQPTVAVHKVEVGEEDGDEKEQDVKVMPPLQKKKGIDHVKYSRTVVPEGERCTSVTHKGVHCTLRRAGSGLYCSIHAKYGVKQNQKQNQKQTEKQQEESDSDDECIACRGTGISYWSDDVYGECFECGGVKK